RRLRPVPRFGDNSGLFPLRLGRRPRASVNSFFRSAQRFPGTEMRATTSRALLARPLASGLSPALPTAFAAADAAASAASQPANAVPAAFAGPFNAAQELLKNGNGAAAL